MDLKIHFSAGGQLARKPLWKNIGAVTRDVGGPVALVVGDLFVLLVHRHDYVVDDLAGGRKNFEGCDPLVFRERGLHHIALVGQVACSLDVVGLAQGDDEVWLTDGPFRRVGEATRGVRGIAEGAVRGINPSQQVGLVAFAE